MLVHLAWLMARDDCATRTLALGQPAPLPTAERLKSAAGRAVLRARACAGLS